MSDVAGTIASLRTQAELGLMNLPDDHQYVGYGDAATALQTLTDKVEALTLIGERILERGYISEFIEEEREDHLALRAALLPKKGSRHD